MQYEYRKIKNKLAKIINILIIPSHSSSWNPIEKVFTEVKRIVYNKKIVDREDLAELIQSSLCQYR